MPVRIWLFWGAAVCLLHPMAQLGAQAPARPSAAAALPPDVITLACAPPIGMGPRVEEHCERFRDPRFLAIYGGSAHRQWDPPTLYARLTAAHQAGEEYKALFLARLFTEIAPTNAAGWTNRAALAQALGAADEARASTEQKSGPFKPSFLPGSITRRPTTLADWAALVALMAVDTEAAMGSPQMLYVPNDVTGMLITPGTPGEYSPRYGYTGVHPSGEAKGVLFEDLLPNATAAAQLKPMEVTGGRSTAATVLGVAQLGLSGFSQAQGDFATGQQLSREAINNITMVQSVPSIYKGGGFQRVTWANGVRRDAPDMPRSSGTDQAVHLPMPIPWSAGSPWSLTVPVRAIGKAGGDNHTVMPKEWTPVADPGATKKKDLWAAYAKREGASGYLVGMPVKEIPSGKPLQLLRLARFSLFTLSDYERYGRGVTVMDDAFRARENAPPQNFTYPRLPPNTAREVPMATLIETLLTKADIQALAPDIGSMWPDLSAAEAWYAHDAIAVEFEMVRQLTGSISAGVASTIGGLDNGLILFDGSRTYTYQLLPSLWLAPATGK